MQELEVALASGGLDVSARARAGLLGCGLESVFGAEALAVVVGHSRALWPAFSAGRRAEDEPHPLDRYVERVVTQAAATLGVPVQIRFSHVGPPFLPIQQAAVAAGLAWLSPGRLAVHPVYGPWIGLRAVIVADLPGPATAPAPAPPCDACDSGCEPRFREACASGGDWRLFLAARDACPLGREHRYPETMVRHGYAALQTVVGSGVAGLPASSRK